MVELDKGLNFCPSTIELDTEKLIHGVSSYCKAIQSKHRFASQNADTDTSPQETVLPEEEHCEMKSK